MRGKLKVMGGGPWGGTEEMPGPCGRGGGGGPSGATSFLRGKGQNGGAGGVEGGQILESEEQSILEGSDRVQMYVSSVGFQAT